MHGKSAGNQQGVFHLVCTKLPELQALFTLSQWGSAVATTPPELSHSPSCTEPTSPAHGSLGKVGSVAQHIPPLMLSHLPTFL